MNTNLRDNWDKVFKNGLSKYCGRQPLKSFKGYSLLKQTTKLTQSTQSMGKWLKNALTLSWWRAISYRNQTIDLRSKSMDWFLYDIGPHHERVKQMVRSIIPKVLKSKVLLIVTAVFWKTSRLWGLKQVPFGGVTTGINHYATWRLLFSIKRTTH